jgi:hypothetical protein
MNLFVLFGDGDITQEKITETLHHALRAMMHPSPNKQKIDSFLKSEKNYNV